MPVSCTAAIASSLPPATVFMSFVFGGPAHHGRGPTQRDRAHWANTTPVSPSPAPDMFHTVYERANTTKDR